MMKKAAALAGAGALVLAMAGSVFAIGGCYGGRCDWDRGGDLTVSNKASVLNIVNTEASTGHVSVGGGNQSPFPCGFGGWTKPTMSMVMTGDAAATSSVSNNVNYNLVGSCDCLDGDTMFKNRARVTNLVNTDASSGYIGVKSGWVMTGGATAKGVVANMVNTNLVGVDISMLE